jgi:hypothetical protein
MRSSKKTAWTLAGIVAVPLGLALLVSRVSGQTTTTASIIGTVTDQSGSVVSDANVTVIDEATGAQRDVRTNQQGQYSVNLLPIGQYTVRVNKVGFQTHNVIGLVLQVNQTVRNDVMLEVGSETQRIQVTATIPLLKTDTSDVGQVVGERQVAELPLNGRNFLQLATLAPGTLPITEANPTQFGSFGGLLIANGADANSNNITLDSVENQDYLEPRVGIRPSPDAIAEFKVLTSNFSAAYGRASGAVVNVVTKSGTNQYRGTAYEFLRNDLFDAENKFNIGAKPPFRQNQFGATFGGPIIKNKTFFFANYDGFRQRKGLTVSAIVPTDAQRNGDLSGGLPIYDPLSIHTDPTTGKLVRTPFGNNLIPPQRISDQAKKVLDLFYPHAQLQIPNQINFTYNPQQTQDYNQILARVDHHISNKDIVFVRAAYNHNPNLFPTFAASNNGYQSLPHMGSIYDFKQHNDVIAYTRIFSTRVINDARIGYNYFLQVLQNELNDKNYVAAIGIQGPLQDPVTWGPPNFNVASINGAGAFQFAPSIPVTSDFTYVDTLSISKGRHNVKLGIDIRRAQQNGKQYPNARGNYGFSGAFTDDPVSGTSKTGQGLADFLLGYPSSSTLTLGGTNSDIRALNAGFFGVDDWAISRDLTLNLGLRWDYQPQPVSANDRIANWDQAANAIVIAQTDLNTIPYCLGCGSKTVAQLIQDYKGSFNILTRNQVGWPHALIRTNYTGFGPRLGFAWRVLGSKDTVLRGGWGKFYEVVTGNHWWNMSNNPPYSRSLAFSANTNQVPTFDLAAPFPATGVQGGATLNGTMYQWNDPYEENWNLTVERQIFTGNAASLAYVGSKGVGMPLNVDFNSPTFGIASVQTLRPDPSHGPTPIAASWGHRWYNSMQATWQTRLSSLTMLASYTWAQSTTDGGGGVSDASTGIIVAWNYLGFRPPVLSGNLSSDDPYLTLASNRGPTAGIDVRHTISVSYVWDLPFGQGKRFNLSGAVNQILGGWELTGVTAWHTGFPITSNGNLICDPNNGAPHTIHQWFKTSCFAAVPTTLFVYNNHLDPLLAVSNASRGPIRGPGYQNWDIGIAKNFPFGDRYGIQFRAEMFNAFNHPNLGEPNTSFGTKTYGQISSTAFNADPRDVQFGLKFSF